MNQIPKYLISKIPSVRFGLWIGLPSHKNKLLTEIQEDVDVVERYAYDFNRFISPGDQSYCRLHDDYLAPMTLNKIESVIAGFNKPRIQMFQIVHSDTTSLLQMGTITGSVKVMVTSEDFHTFFKKKFK